MTVGEVTATSAIVWARSEAARTARVTVMPVGAASPAAAGELVFVAAHDHTGRLAVGALAPATRYAWHVTAGSASAGGEFVTAPAADARAPVTFAWSGDLGGGGFCRRRDGGYPIFRPLAARRPDFFLFVGDTIYADRACGRPEDVPGANFVATTLGQFQARHRYNRSDAAVQAALGATSVYAIWDDHEVRNDFSGPTEPLMAAGRQAFLDYWPIASPSDAPGRLYRRARWGRLLDVFILDTRQYRSPNAEPDGPAKTMLGAAQKRWLLDGVGASDAVWKVVVSSVSLSIPTGRRERRDSWTGVTVFGLPDPAAGTGFARERDEILEALAARGVKNLVVLTTDVHHAEIIRHTPWPGFVVHELVAGPLSATLGTPRPLDMSLNPQSLWGRGGVNNFGEIAVEAGQLTVRIIGEDGAVLGTQLIPTD